MCRVALLFLILFSFIAEVVEPSTSFVRVSSLKIEKIISVHTTQVNSSKPEFTPLAQKERQALMGSIFASHACSLLFRFVLNPITYRREKMADPIAIFYWTVSHSIYRPPIFA